jgi:hypothetical protein
VLRAALHASAEQQTLFDPQRRPRQRKRGLDGDTALLLSGMSLLWELFDTRESPEIEIRRLTEKIYRRVDWIWAQPRAPAIALAWAPEERFSRADWRGYNEAMLVYLLALGSPTHPIGAQAWTTWTST